MDSSKQAQQEFMHFLTAEGVSGADIYRCMKDVYGNDCMSLCIVFRWCGEFWKGRVSTEDMPRKKAHSSIRAGKVMLILGSTNIVCCQKLHNCPLDLFGRIRVTTLRSHLGSARANGT